MNTEVLYYKNTWIINQLLAKKHWQFDQPTLNFMCAHQTGWFTSIASGYDRTVDQNHYPVRLDCSSYPQNASHASLDQIFLDRAKDLWSSNKSLTFLWSGGIDSTSALIALILTNPTWYRDIKVVTTAHSLSQENPAFYKNFLEPYKCLSVVDGITLLSSEFWLEQEQIVTGDCADQLFGFGFVKRLPGNWLTDETIRDVPLDQIRSKAFDLVQQQYQWLNQNNKSSHCLNLFHSLPEARDIFMQWFDAFLSRSPVTLRDGFDFQWWVAFTMKIQMLRHRAAWMMGRTELANRTRYRAFFDCGTFERWAIDHHEEKWPGRLAATYKKPFRDFIYAYTQDEEYHTSKIKTQSWRPSLPESVKPKSIIKYLDSSGLILSDQPDAFQNSQMKLSDQQLQSIML